DVFHNRLSAADPTFPRAKRQRRQVPAYATGVAYRLGPTLWAVRRGKVRRTARQDVSNCSIVSSWQCLRRVKLCSLNRHLSPCPQMDLGLTKRCKRWIVRHKYQSRSVRSVQVEHKFNDHFAVLSIQAACRLVGEKHAGAHDEGP